MRDRALLLLLVVLASGCYASPAANLTSGTDAHTEPVAFKTTVIDKYRTVSEPSPIISKDGTILVCSVRITGWAGTGLWISKDNGSSFQWVGKPLNSSNPSIPIDLTPRSVTGDFGGGDCDTGTDADGRLYYVDLWGQGASLSSSTDKGATWQGIPITAPLGLTDRPWVAGGGPNEVYVTLSWGGQAGGLDDKGVNMPPGGGIWVARSTDGGLTFLQQGFAAGNENRLSLNSNIALDKDHAYLMYAKKVGDGRLAVMLAISNDHGSTWQQRVVAEQAYFPGQCGTPIDIFPSVAADGAGGVYLAWALENPATNRIDLFMASSRDSGATWNKPVLVTDRAGTRAFPWIAARGPGDVGLVWFEANATYVHKTEQVVYCRSHAPPDIEWFLHYANTTDPFDAAPKFTDTLVQPQPTHKGLLEGAYAEVLQLRYTPDGHAATAYVADVPEGTARPIFAVQASS